MTSKDRESAEQLLAQARGLRAAGRYTEALEVLERCEEWEPAFAESAVALKARLLSRTDPLASLAYLARCQDVFESDEGRFAYDVVSMRNYIGTRNFEAAEEMSKKAGALEGRMPVAQRCQLWHLRTLLALCVKQYDPKNASIEALLGSGDANGQYLGHIMRGYMYASLENYDAQTADLIAGVDIANAHPGACDPALLALQVHALLRLGLERGHRDAVEKGIDAMEAMPWSDDLRADRFLCVRAVAWDAFLRGDAVQAQWMLKDSKSLATTDAWRIMAHLDRAYVARMQGNEYWAAEELAAAHAIARTVDWGLTHNEERQALVMLAVLYAPTDMALAQHYVSLYLRLGRESMDPTLQASRDIRAVAFEAYALGRVQQVIGNNELAEAAFLRAYEIFDKANYHFRAALSALGLYEVTRDERWRERAKTHAKVFPNSAIYTMLQQKTAASDDERLRDLTPMQRQIAMALCEGLEMAEMSERFSRSAFTLQKHVDAIYSQLGVKNRQALRASIGEKQLV